MHTLTQEYTYIILKYLTYIQRYRYGLYHNNIIRNRGTCVIILLIKKKMVLQLTPFFIILALRASLLLYYIFIILFIVLYTQILKIISVVDNNIAII